jgi:ATP synthase F0 sector subunit B|nr:MAG TPA: hypothetical protein [Caudoviricetes sp.]
MLEEFLERIAKSLDSIDLELKARNEDRKILLNQSELIEKTCLDIKEDPFGLNGLKRKALADRVKQKE